MTSDFDSAEFGDPPRRVGQTQAAPAAPDVADEWWDLEAAEAATSVPKSTIRRWHRRGVIESRLIDTTAGSRIEVHAPSVVERASTRQEHHPASPPSSAQMPPQPRRETDASTGETHSDGPELHQDPAHPDRASTEPDDAILVPLDSWQRMLNQLGNLHEVGQQLADARERAAKAETEATFLRERLAEMRTAQVEHEPSSPVAEAGAVDRQNPTEPPPRAPTPDAPVPRTTAGRAVDRLLTRIGRAVEERRHR